MQAAATAFVTEVLPQPGDLKTFSIGPFTHKRIGEFCRQVGDTNRYYVDSDCAMRIWHRVRPVPFAAVVVPALLVLNACPGEIIEWLGPGATVVEMHTRFLAPIFSGEVVDLSMMLTKREPSFEGTFNTLEVVAQVASNTYKKPVLKASLRMFVPTPGTVL